MFERIKEKRNEGGFTLIELLIVIIILAILAAIVVFAVGTTSKNSAVSSCNADAKSVETAVEAYHAQTGTYATSVSVLTGTVTTNGSTVGPWLRSVPGTNHYVISINATNAGEVDVAAGTIAAANYDVTNNCGQAS